MNIKEYISSGILELYVLNQLSQAESEEVEKLANDHIEVKLEIEKISKALEQYALQTAILMPEGLSDKIIASLPNKSNIKTDTHSKASTQNIFKILSYILTGLSFLLAYLYFRSSQKIIECRNEIKSYQMTCDSIRNIYNQQKDYATDLQSENNRIVQLEPTPNFNKSVVFIYQNDLKKTNYLQIGKLPTLGKNKAFQLWALKEGQDPIPLEVFNLSNTIIPVTYQADVNYAITIEDQKGALVPDLTQLIGIFKTTG